MVIFLFPSTRGARQGLRFPRKPDQPTWQDSGCSHRNQSMDLRDKSVDIVLPVYP